MSSWLPADCIYMMPLEDAIDQLDVPCTSLRDHSNDIVSQQHLCSLSLHQILLWLECIAEVGERREVIEPLVADVLGPTNRENTTAVASTRSRVS